MTNGVVIFQGDKITDAGSNLPIPQGAQVIDLGDATLSPGFMDAHTHLTADFSGNYNQRRLQEVDLNVSEQAIIATTYARATIEAGFTTVRDLGSRFVGSKEFVELREQIWLSVMEAAAANQTRGLIFTFNPENSVRQSFIEEVQSVTSRHGGTIDFVEILCDAAVLETRLDTPERRKLKKLLSVELFRELHGKGAFDSPRMPAPTFRVDTTRQSPRESAAQIVEALGLPCSGERCA